MPSKRPPVYPARPHASNQARIKVNGRTLYLGVFGSPESHLRYQALLQEWLAGNPAPGVPRPDSAAGRRVGDVLGLFLAAAAGGERKTSAKELKHFRRLAVHLAASKLSDRLAATFDADCLDAFRSFLTGLGHGRRHVARQCVRVRTIWRWAERKKLVPMGSWAHLQTLQLGTGEAHEEVEPVPEKDLAATLPHLGRIPRAMVEVQLLSGARPGEVLKLTPAHFRTSGEVKIGRAKLKLGPVWVAELGLDHKTGWRGYRKYLFFGPKAQAILRPFLDRPADARLFSPREATLEYLRSARRKDGSPVKVALRRGRSPNPWYSVYSYEDAIERACKRAGVPRWSPGQLRHSAATRLAEEFGPEVARIVLGHRELAVTRAYIQDDLRRAAEAIAKAG